MDKGIESKSGDTNVQELKNGNITSNNVSACDLDPETTKKLRGDAIGDTLYSQTFVLKTLLQFSDLMWNKEMEEDLCFIWDMTVEVDVCKFLFEVSYPSIACGALLKYNENRFVEIVIGILANILCADCDKNLNDDQINIILKELETDDHLILIQVVRFISALAHMSNELPLITEEELSKLHFILCNSTNNDLLLKTLEAVSKITTDCKVNIDIINIDLMNSALTAYRTIINSDEIQLDAKDKQVACRYMLEIISNTCLYADKFKNRELLVEIQNFSDIFASEVNKILQYYSFQENLLPITDEFIYFMFVFRYVLETMNVNYLSSLFISLSKILCIVANIKDEVSELFDSVVELECFFLFRGSPEQIQKDLRLLSKSKVVKMLQLVDENKDKYVFNLKLSYLLDSYS